MKSAPYTGPEPTLQQLQSQFGWVRARCGVCCAHYAAIPLDRIIPRLGTSAPANALRKRLRCTACGKRGAEIRAPSMVGHDLAALPADKVPAALRIADRVPHSWPG
jgi:hypothetical protein